MKSYIKNITRVATLGLTTSIAAICMSNQAEAATIDYTYQSDNTAKNNQYSGYGFKMNLSSSLLGPSSSSATVTSNTSVAFSEMTIQMRDGQTNVTGIETGFLVLDDAGNVLGLAQTQAQTSNNATMTYSFTNTNGDALIIDSSTTYTFKSVNSTAISTITESFGNNISYTYTGDGTNAVLSGGNTTIQNTALLFGFGTDKVGSDGGDLCVINNANNGGLTNHKPILTSIKFASIPEPTTATLSLLGLGALLLRRRRTV